MHFSSLPLSCLIHLSTGWFRQDLLKIQKTSLFTDALKFRYVFTWHPVLKVYNPWGNKRIEDHSKTIVDLEAGRKYPHWMLCISVSRKQTISLDVTFLPTLSPPPPPPKKCYMVSKTCRIILLRHPIYSRFFHAYKTTFTDV